MIQILVVAGSLLLVGLEVLRLVENQRRGSTQVRNANSLASGSEDVRQAN